MSLASYHCSTPRHEVSRPPPDTFFWPERRCDSSLVLYPLRPKIPNASVPGSPTGEAMTQATAPTSTDRTSRANRREWAPRIWEGIDFFAWVRLLARHRFAVGWSYLYIVAIVTVVSVFHTLLRF